MDLCSHAAAAASATAAATAAAALKGSAAEEARLEGSTGRAAADNFKQSEISQDSYEETVTILLQELQSSSIVQALM